MERFSPRELMARFRHERKTNPQWWTLTLDSVPKWHEIEFDDGVVITSHIKQSFWSALLWAPVDLYPHTKLTEFHHITRILKEGESITGGTHRKLSSRILESIVTENDLFLPESREDVLDAIYESISDAMLAITRVSTRHVPTLDYLHMTQIAKHPEITKIKEWAYQDPRRIKAAYDQSMTLIRTLPEFRNNGMSMAARCGMAKPNQVVQCVVFRGYGSEVSGAVFEQTPIWGNYTLGVDRLFDFTADSRSAAKSHYYADSSLKTSEYMSRKFRLFTNQVEKIDYQDCGTTETRSWMVAPPVMDSAGSVTYKGDLPNLIGKEYFTDDAPTRRIIRGNEKHLIGKTIQLRTALRCKTPNPHMRCFKCVGMLHMNISRFANIGHLAAISVAKPASQAILSIKHVNTSSSVVRIMLDEFARKFFHTGEESAALYFNTGMLNIGATFTVSKDEVTGLSDVMNSDDLSGVSLTQVSEVSQIRINTVLNGREVPTTVNISQKQRKPIFTLTFLEHIKETGWTIDDRGDFVFPMSGIPPDLAIFAMPPMEESYSDLVKQIEALVSSKLSKKRDRTNIDAPDRLLREFFDLVNSMLSVNILAMELMVYSLMVKGPRSYELAGSSPDAVLGLADGLRRLRSLPPAMLYQGMDLTLTSPVNFLSGKRPDSPFDVLFNPQEVVTEYLARGYG